MQTCASCKTPFGSTDESGRFCPACGAELGVAPASTTLPLPGAVSSPSAATTAPVDTAASLIGQTIGGQFTLDAVIGGGSFGTVYRGRQLGIDRPVAIKVPTHEIAADPVMARRFAREARAAARVDHPGVVAIYAVGELPDGRPYLAMQYVEGEPLDRILADGPLPAPRALAILRAVASVLSETHAADVVHRDLKPTNIIWRRDRNGDDRITLVDFGIAVCRPGNADATRLTTNGLIGTPHYMSPEQAHGEQVDARADLYALGCVLYELVTGAPPFEGSGFEVLLAHLGRTAPPPSAISPDVPDVVDRLCAALLAKRPDDRPASAAAIVALVDDALTGLRASGLGPPEKRRRRRASTELRKPDGKRPARRVLRAGGLVLALAAAAAGGYALRGHLGPLSGGDELADSADGPTDPAGPHRRTIVRDDGDLVLQALVPDPLAAHRAIRAHLVLRNKLGEPLSASQLVVTVTDGNGTATGLVAQPHHDHAGHFTFSYTFPSPGPYVVRVFPPSSGDSTFELPLVVR